MGPGSVSAGIHAGLGRSGRGEGVLIDKTGQEGVLRESPQPCCPLSPHRALAATSRSRSRVVLAECAAQGRVSSGPGIHQLASRRGARIDSRDLPVPYSRRPPQSHGPPPPVLPVRPGACFGHGAQADEGSCGPAYSGSSVPPDQSASRIFGIFKPKCSFLPRGGQALPRWPRRQSSPMRAEGRVPGSGTWRGLVGHRAQTRPGVGLRDNAPGRPPGAARRPAPAPGHMAAGSVTVSANPIIFATSRSFSLPGRPVSIFRGPAARVVEHRPIARLGLQPIFAFPDFSRRSDRRHFPRGLLARGEPWGVSNPHALARLRRNYS